MKYAYLQTNHWFNFKTMGTEIYIGSKNGSKLGKDTRDQKIGIELQSRGPVRIDI